MKCCRLPFAYKKKLEAAAVMKSCNGRRNQVLLKVGTKDQMETQTAGDGVLRVWVQRRDCSG